MFWSKLKKLTEENIELKIDNIINNFDFEKVNRVMQFLDWKWALVNWKWAPAEYRVPTIKELKNHAFNILKEATSQALKNGEWSVACGGFKANAWKKDNKINCSLVFQLETYEE